MDLKAYILEKNTLVNQALEEALSIPDDPSRELFEAMRYSVLAGGKRLRPVLCLAAAEAVGGHQDQALPAAVAIELIHTSTLIHDDLPGLDNDDLRRGQPANHRIFGEGLAILAGDGLMILGLGLVIRAALDGRIDPVRAMTAQEVIVKASGPRGIIAGQAVDLASEGKPVGLKTVDFIHDHKTASLMAASVASGAILAGAGQDQAQALAIYGRKIGQAFQIVDDLLDIEGQTETIGKPVGSDQARGKATYPSFAGIEGSKQAAARLLREALEALAGFSPLADPLREIGSYLITRKK